MYCFCRGIRVGVFGVFVGEGVEVKSEMVCFGIRLFDLGVVEFGCDCMLFDNKIE